MEKSEVLERVCKVVAELMKVDATGLEDGTVFTKDLGMESVQSLELIASFEDEFDIEMDEDEAGTVQTVGTAVDFIKNIIDQQEG